MTARPCLLILSIVLPVFMAFASAASTDDELDEVLDYLISQREAEAARN